jgi:hypothetical protein
MNDHLNARAKVVWDVIAAGPDSRAKTILENYRRTGAWIEHGDAEKREVKELLLSAMAKEASK